MTNYKTRIATNNHIHIYKECEIDSRINQIVILTRSNNNKALVELRIENTCIDQELIDRLQIALNRARKDARVLQWKEFSKID